LIPPVEIVISRDLKSEELFARGVKEFESSSPGVVDPEEGGGRR